MRRAIGNLAAQRLIVQHGGKIGEPRRNRHVVTPVGLTAFQDGAVQRQKHPHLKPCAEAGNRAGLVPYRATRQGTAGLRSPEMPERHYALMNRSA